MLMLCSAVNQSVCKQFCKLSWCVQLAIKVYTMLQTPLMRSMSCVQLPSKYAKNVANSHDVYSCQSKCIHVMLQTPLMRLWCVQLPSKYAWNVCKHSNYCVQLSIKLYTMKCCKPRSCAHAVFSCQSRCIRKLCCKRLGSNQSACSHVHGMPVANADVAVNQSAYMETCASFWCYGQISVDFTLN